MASEKAIELAKRLWDWEPHSDGQREWLLCDAKVKVGACGRRWGKSESMAVDIVLYALENPGHIQMLIAPTDDQTSIIMDDVERRVYAVPGLARCFNHRKSPYTEIAFKDGGGLQTGTTIMARTAGTTGKGLRGRKAHRVITDEAAFVSDKIMQQVVGPLLADYDGQLVEVSTPQGRNHFFDSFTRGQDPKQPRYRSFRFPTSANPYIPRAYLENEKQTKPERTFGQEYLAEFLDGEGAVFRKVEKAATAEPPSLPIAGHQYLFGVDWARSHDFTVIVVIDMTARKMVHIERMNQVDFALQRLRLTALYERYRPVTVIAESNSIGMPNIELLVSEGMTVYPFLTTNASKAAIIDALVLALEQETLGLLNDPVLLGELLAYEGKKLPSGLIRYGAPEGMHDDCVIALALAVWGMSELSRGSEWFIT